MFSTSIAIVIGPTPPGTGEIAPAFPINDSLSASPTNFLFPLDGSLILLMPTSIIIAPFLI